MLSENRCEKAKRIFLMAREKASSLVWGTAPSRIKGLGLEYEDFRDYRFEDDYRFIDWKLSARMIKPNGEMRLIVKEYRSEKKLHILLVFDYTLSVKFKEKFLTALYVLTLICEAARRLDDEITLVVLSDRISVYPRLDSWRIPYVVLKHICRAPPRGSLSLSSVVEVAEKLGRRKPVVVITDYANRLEDYSKLASLPYSPTAFYLVYSLGEVKLSSSASIRLIDPELGVSAEDKVSRVYGKIGAHVLAVKGVLKTRSVFMDLMGLRDAEHRAHEVVFNYCAIRERGLR
ncbi:MAG: hypothetical protein DRJ63_09005 [Thermoprotei archaeon]|nr:MAG: hypothetical protein DRJ63_09005 [Thermoprotei archaeon]